MTFYYLCYLFITHYKIFLSFTRREIIIHIVIIIYNNVKKACLPIELHKIIYSINVLITNISIFQIDFIALFIFLSDNKVFQINLNFCDVEAFALQVFHFNVIPN